MVREIREYQVRNANTILMEINSCMGNHRYELIEYAETVCKYSERTIKKGFCF